MVSDLRLRLESGEEIQSILADLEYGVMAELDEFARRLLVLLTATLGGGTMDHTIYNGLSASPQPAKTLLHEVPTRQFVFEEAKVNLRKLWRAAYAEAGVRTVSECFIRCATRMRLTWPTKVWSCPSLLVSWAIAT